MHRFALLPDDRRADQSPALAPSRCRTLRHLRRRRRRWQRGPACTPSGESVLSTPETAVPVGTTRCHSNHGGGATPADQINRPIITHWHGDRLVGSRSWRPDSPFASSSIMDDRRPTRRSTISTKTYPRLTKKPRTRFEPGDRFRWPVSRNWWSSSTKVIKHKAGRRKREPRVCHVGPTTTTRKTRCPSAATSRLDGPDRRTSVICRPRTEFNLMCPNPHHTVDVLLGLHTATTRRIRRCWIHAVHPDGHHERRRGKRRMAWSSTLLVAGTRRSGRFTSPC